MSKRLFLIFLVLLVLGSAILLNQYAPIPVGNLPQTQLPLLPSIRDGIPKATKSITITSTPSSISIFLDDTNMGQTPLTLANLSHNSYSLRAQKENFTTQILTLVPSESNGLVQIDMLPIQGLNEPDLTTNPSGLDSTDNIGNLINNDPQIPTDLLGLVTVPEGYRFPAQVTDITQRINLEIIPPDPAQPLVGLARSNLIARLVTLYYYDPQTVSIMADNTFTPQGTAIFDGKTYDPTKGKLFSGDSIVWYNHTSITCQLRTDPQSPVKINQLIPATKSLPLTLTDKGIYIFYCQGQPGPTYTLVVS